MLPEPIIKGASPLPVSGSSPPKTEVAENTARSANVIEIMLKERLEAKGVEMEGIVAFEVRIV